MFATPTIRRAGLLPGVLTLLLLTVVTACGGSTTADQAATKVTITAPTDKASVPQEQSVSGTATGVPVDKDLWIFTKKGTKTHPQSTVIKVNSDGTWTQKAYVGGSTGDDNGASFDILVYLVPKAGSVAITAYLKAAAATGKYPGLTPPTGSTETAKITVIKKA